MDQTNIYVVELTEIYIFPDWDLMVHMHGIHMMTG